MKLSNLIAASKANKNKAENVENVNRLKERLKKASMQFEKAEKSKAVTSELLNRTYSL